MNINADITSQKSKQGTRVGGWDGIELNQSHVTINADITSQRTKKGGWMVGVKESPVNHT